MNIHVIMYVCIEREMLACGHTSPEGAGGCGHGRDVYPEGSLPMAWCYYTYYH